ncbi:amino acid ABC transporter ATP-binding protein [Halonatronum saccharophilum]|uniref:amino acid ABC transporter ATP-binding protein n=1 Tax=Halonatronum saccharophilum TaxID=150060 RepID=UPI000486574A|nr:amino acid ABC transporter ATP-binding protein [Halonatronum saccharophilum]
MLEVNDLKKSYGEVEVLKGVSFRVEEGETVVIMGPSGCGKSTTIRCINRLTEADSGDIIFKGIPILDLQEDRLLEIRGEIGFVFQNFNLIGRLTTLENVMLPLIQSSLPKKEVEKRAIGALEKVKLDDKLNSYSSNLSGGQQQRVGIARALVVQPSLMLLDEPTASLDPILVKEVLEVIEDLTKDSDKSVIIVTHEISFALKVADKILLMDDGIIVEEGSPDNIFEAPKSNVGRRYKELLEYY